METVILVIHLMLAVALIGVIMMQRTAQDGGGLMGGGGSTMGGLFTARGSANLLTRITAGLATAFICTSLILGIIASQQHKQRSIAEQIAPIAPASAPASETPAGSPVEAPAAPAPAMPAPPQVPVSK